jgi:hypothetical protein
MLKIVLKGYNERTTFDVDDEFSKIRLPDTAKNRQIIERIEQGKYEDEIYYIDRFGYKLYKQYMSSGCKAALLIQNTDLVVDTTECGANAIAAILNLCDSGSAILVDKNSKLPYSQFVQNGTKCNIEFNGYHFTDIRRLNKYIEDEYEDIDESGNLVEPDLKSPGIEKL